MRRLARVMAVAAFVLVMAPGSAFGSGTWPWPVDGDVVLPYGAPYRSAAGVSCTHGGLDIAAAPGSGVRACAAGTVSFAGRVPAGEGRQAFAVTVSCADGLRVTYLPLREVRVRKGQSVDAGDALGMLETEGDASGSAPHLHIGVQRGSASLDPAGFLAAPGAVIVPAAPTPADAHAPAPAPARARNSAVADAPAVSAAARVSAAAPDPAQALASANAHSSVPVPADAASPAPSMLPAPDGRQVVRDAARIAADALTGGPALDRISALSDAPTLDVGRMLADIAAGRGFLGGLLLRLALAVGAAACVVPVVRGARRATAAQLPAALAPVRRATR